MASHEDNEKFIKLKLVNVCDHVFVTGIQKNKNVKHTVQW